MIEGLDWMDYMYARVVQSVRNVVRALRLGFAIIVYITWAVA